MPSAGGRKQGASFPVWKKRLRHRPGLEFKGFHKKLHHFRPGESACGVALGLNSKVITTNPSSRPGKSAYGIALGLHSKVFTKTASFPAQKNTPTASPVMNAHMLAPDGSATNRTPPPKWDH